MREGSVPFFSDEEEQRIVFAIQHAERATSGEIRVHVSHMEEQDSLERTKEIFDELRMYNTRERNAVLIHLSVGSRKFAVYGDEGINRVVESDFWQCTCEIMEKHFAEGRMVEGIAAGVENIGKRLKSYFPHAPEHTNELKDDITYD
ncbi:MAG: TPM domain-containing protein [Weeksellaceae bacterium]|nr:TPM domain-containing protein [Weeksellaceae bacterium]